MNKDNVLQTATETAAQTAHQIANTGNGITGASSAWAVWAGLTLNDWGVIVGIAGVIVGALITYFYKRKEVELKRDIAERELKLEQERAERDRQAFELKMLKEHGPSWRCSLEVSLSCK